MRTEEIEHIKTLGELELRLEVADGRYGVPGSALRSEANDWLAVKHAAAELEASGKRDGREERTLAIAERALSISEEAKAEAASQAKAAWRASRYAMYAAIVATTALLISNKKEIVALVISWLP